ncbi:hypothetical protein QCD60_17505 [Pokkaliibacter sp. MBI-7]|uniref:hypothetical protein n=1 Tax=Pokkaliibacter sp. MBI-7 TaxID=3040600 RepID=UPI00244D3AB1|nr:hypothetical protein [Pokkaliibacter sp. MBI-7]MDH2434358.1 hypothetical protein [Pokkaliibacter sp. MBI-7]
MKYVIGIVIAALAAVWWYLGPPGPASYVEVEFIAPKGVEPLSVVEFMAGEDKASLVNIAPGEVQAARIYPGESAGSEIGLIVFRSASSDEGAAIRPVDWIGARPFAADTAFRIHFQIDQKGQVLSGKSCQLPCSFN